MLNLLSKLLIIFSLSLAWVSSNVIAASCTGNATTASMPQLVLNPAENGAVGTVLGSHIIPVRALNYTCGAGINTRLTSTFTRGNSVSAHPDVYNTEIGGVGIRIKWPVSRISNYFPTIHTCYSPCTESSDNLLIEFVQTGRIVAGDIPSGEIANVVLTAADESSNSFTLLSVVLSSNTSVVVRSCMITNSDLSVNLGNYPLSDFKVGNKHGAVVPFSVIVYCPQATSVKIAFTAVEQPLVGLSRGVMQNTIPVASGGAKGIGTRMLSSNGIIAQQINGEKSSAFPINAGENKELKYFAQMYILESNRANITAGNVAGQVYFNLTIE